jgi:hypothetical protein
MYRRTLQETARFWIGVIEFMIIVLAAVVYLFFSK